jgi:transcriptional regulator with XRE-family HTH domain
MDLQGAVKRFLAKEGITQEQLAARAEVSQSTVSRAMSRSWIRAGPARARLVSFMQAQGAFASPPTTVLEAVTEIWDGSQAHAAALATLVLASRELWPNLRKE